MATPYFQLTFDSVPSTQDVARRELDELPILVIAAEQTAGRGRAGAAWENADRSLAVSLAYRNATGDGRPLSLMAGVAAVRATGAVGLKWPNDLMSDEDKVGGILVEVGDEVTVVGLGVNLWWPSPPEGVGALFAEDPGPRAHVALGALWGAEMFDLIDRPGWPIDEYREASVTIGRHVAWEPGGNGLALDVEESGALIVRSNGAEDRLHSGAVRHVRPVAE